MPEPHLTTGTDQFTYTTTGGTSSAGYPFITGASTTVSDTLTFSTNTTYGIPFIPTKKKKSTSSS